METAGSTSEAATADMASWSVLAWTEPAIRALGRSDWLNSLGRRLGNAFHRLVPAGRTKDSLAGTWIGHPLHPILTDVTIGTWTSAAILDVLGPEKARPAADTLIGVGILSAVPTAITGLCDLTDIVDREERAVGTAHALANTAALALWTLSYLARKAGSRRAGTALSIAGATVMSGAGFLGGHLSFRMGVGVDQTAFDRRLDGWTAILDERELEERKPRRVMVSGIDVFLYRAGENLHALANRCTHRGGPLQKGSTDEHTVTCPWHLSMFRLEDGSVLRGPATAPQPSYEARVHDGAIEIRSTPIAKTSR